VNAISQERSIETERILDPNHESRDLGGSNSHETQLPEVMDALVVEPQKPLAQEAKEEAREGCHVDRHHIRNV
jgi:hypothetical protein